MNTVTIPFIFASRPGTLDCVTCQQCRLHGKLQLLGLGTALKILLLPSHLLPASLTSNELVALFNTLDSFSKAITGARLLSEQYMDLYEARERMAQDTSTLSSSSSETNNLPPITSSPLPVKPTTHSPILPRADPVDKERATGGSGGSGGHVVTMDAAAASLVTGLDAALSAISQGAQHTPPWVTVTQEQMLIDLCLTSHPGLLLLAKHYASDHPRQFIQHALRNIPALSSQQTVFSYSNLPVATESEPETIRVVIVGGGLAGLTTALSLLDRGAHVILIDKEKFFGGNSAKASSGINGIEVDETGAPVGPDSVETYAQDTLQSGQQTSNPLVAALTEGSVQALQWVRNRVKLPLDKTALMGGHSYPRTHRPSSGMAGIELVYAVQREVKKYLKQGALTLYRNTKVTSLLTEDAEEQGQSRVTGVVCESFNQTQGDTTDDLEHNSFTILASYVVLATGGFSVPSKDNIILSEFRPDLAHMPTSNGAWATGDGHVLGRRVGGRLVDMTEVQIHPSGFVDPARPDAPVKLLCAEMMRGAGALLFNAQGRRFGNELGRRDYMTERFRLTAESEAEQAARETNKHQRIGWPELWAYIVLHPAAAAVSPGHLDLYTQKGVLQRADTLEELAGVMLVSVETLREAIQSYDRAAVSGEADEFGKTKFPNVPFLSTPEGPFYVGVVTPIVHYTMGGLAVDTHGRVLRQQGKGVIPGLFAVGEATGGIHGKNRLGGNALTECVVFGLEVGNYIPLAVPAGSGEDISAISRGGTPEAGGTSPTDKHKKPVLTWDELSEHNTDEDCWVALYGEVYDLSGFAEEHPGGVESILDHCGTDGTSLFDAVHTRVMLEDFDLVGIIKQD